jgi:hypothetical protein
LRKARTFRFSFEEVESRGEGRESGNMGGGGKVDGSITERATGEETANERLRLFEEKEGGRRCRVYEQLKEWGG